MKLYDKILRIITKHFTNKVESAPSSSAAKEITDLVEQEYSSEQLKEYAREVQQYAWKPGPEIIEKMFGPLMNILNPENKPPCEHKHTKFIGEDNFNGIWKNVYECEDCKIKLIIP